MHKQTTLLLRPPGQQGATKPTWLLTENMESNHHIYRASGCFAKPQTQGLMQEAQRDPLSYLCLEEIMQAG
ncbi:hypothetical protein AMECASPLE_020575 [Ameca splendens]|uniref:Uncharacterized protein n=1 Tax=Ameca splendens TaxID=208324 RepID=A0ABV0XSG9_9TELE